MIRGLLFLLFVAVVIYLVVLGTYHIYRKVRREDILDDKALLDDDNWPFGR